MKTVFTDRTANIIAEIRTRTCIDKIDEEVIFEILQAEFKNYYNAGYDAGYNELCWALNPFEVREVLQECFTKLSY